MTRLLDRIKLLISFYCGDGRGRFTCFSRLTGINYTTIINWHENGVSNPQSSTVDKICKACEVSPDWLLYGKGPTPHHIFGVDNVTNITDNKPRYKVRDLKKDDFGLPEHYTDDHIPIEGSWIKVPVISYAQAGMDGFFEDPYPVGVGEETIMVHSSQTKGDSHVYALRVRGRSMEPLIKEGSVILVSPAVSIDSGLAAGDPCVVKVKGGEVMVKFFRPKGDNLYLFESAHTDYESPLLHRSEIETYFPQKVIWLRF